MSSSALLSTLTSFSSYALVRQHREELRQLQQQRKIDKRHTTKPNVPSSCAVFHFRHIYYNRFIAVLVVALGTCKCQGKKNVMALSWWRFVAVVVFLVAAAVAA